MRKLTARQIRRLLSAREAPEPPDGLADRIKAGIPEVVQVGGAALERENVRAVPRPFWLIAASLLVVVGAGYMVIRLVGPSESLSRRIALDGVTVIRDVVVTVPERSAVDRQKLALAMPASKPADKASRPDTSPKGRFAPGVAPLTTAKKPPASEADAEEARETQIGGAGREPAVVTAQGRMAEEVALGGAVAVNEARPAAVADKMDRAAAPPRASSGSIIVVVRDGAGKPVAGASVRLDRSDQPDVNCGSRTTGAGGAASFCCVTPGTYRICAQLQGFVAGTADVVVAPGAQLSVPLTLNRPPADGQEHPWTCPTPSPPARR